MELPVRLNLGKVAKCTISAEQKHKSSRRKVKTSSRTGKHNIVRLHGRCWTCRHRRLKASYANTGFDHYANTFSSAIADGRSAEVRSNSISKKV